MVQRFGSPFARGHLRLASAPAVHGPGRRIARRVRAWLTALALLLTTLAGWFMAALALAPLLVRRSPVGHRLRRHAPREARIIPFQPRKRALPR
jgi:hypothetical protein